MENIVLLYFYKLSDKYCVEIKKQDHVSMQYYYDHNIIHRKLNELRQLARDDEICFNFLKAWDDVVNIDLNYTVLIAYNTEKNIIQGWCNLRYKDFNYNGEDHDKYNGTNIYYLELQKLVTRSEPRINRLGTYMLHFIKNRCLNNIIYNGHKINVDILYLYSFPTSEAFYRKLGFLSENTYEDNTTFYYINEHARPYLFQNKDVMESMITLWEFEYNAHMNEEEIEIYKNNTNMIATMYKERCNMPKIRSIFQNNVSKNDRTVKRYRKTIRKTPL